MKIETVVKSRRLQHLGGQAEEQPISELAPASQQVLGKASWVSIFLAQQLRIFRSKHNKLSFHPWFFSSSCLTTSSNRFTLSCCPKYMKKEIWLRNLGHDTFFQFFHPSRREAFPPIFYLYNYSGFVTGATLLKYLSDLFSLSIRNHLRYWLLLTVQLYN